MISKLRLHSNLKSIRTFSNNFTLRTLSLRQFSAPFNYRDFKIHVPDTKLEEIASYEYELDDKGNYIYLLILFR